jgi:hypothetical protein
MTNLHDLKNYNNFSKIDSMSPAEIQKWYLIIKNSLDKLSRHYTDSEMARIKQAIAEYETRHGLL